MNNEAYINSLKKIHGNPWSRRLQKVLGGVFIICGILIAGEFLRFTHMVSCLDKTIEDTAYPLLENDQIETEDVAHLSITLHELTTARMQATRYTAPNNLLLALLIAIIGASFFLGEAYKQSGLVLLLLTRIEKLEERLDQQQKDNFAKRTHSIADSASSE